MSDNKSGIILSIVIVNFENKDLTIKCLRSIQKESQGLIFEVILIDNGSSDGSVKLFEKLNRENFWKDKLKLIKNNSNLGYAKANNQGIKISSGRYVFLLNNDTIVLKNSLQNIIKFAQNTPGAGVIGSKLLNFDRSLQNSCYHFPSVINAIREFWFGQKGLFDKYAPQVNHPSTVDSVVGAAFLITPLAVKRVGLLDERYFAYFEDIDYCRKVWKAGLKVYYLPDSVIVHHHGATFKKLSGTEEQWKKLIPSSKIYHGTFRYYIIHFILWTGQKWHKLFFGNN